jgi:peptidoglycan/LPS O-acetylase OafA/YrhL
MNHKIYNWITSLIIFGVWIYFAINVVKAFFQISKMNGISRFMTSREFREIKDPETKDALMYWKRRFRRLFLLWVVTAVFFFILSILIDRTIGFRD